MHFAAGEVEHEPGELRAEGEVLHGARGEGGRVSGLVRLVRERGEMAAYGDCG